MSTHGGSPWRVPRRPDPVRLAGLRAAIRRLERGGLARTPEPEAIPLGAPEIDQALPWGGLRRAALHEILGGDGAWGFAAGAAARLAGSSGTVLWCRRGDELYGPGLAAFGIDLKRLIVVRTRTATETLWALEEGLRSGSLAVALGEAFAVSPIALRRLQLAAETGGATGLLLRPGASAATASPALTRWRVAAAPPPSFGRDSRSPGAAFWRIDLLRCRGGAPAAWLVEWRNGPTGGFRVVADLRDRPAQATAEPRAVGGRSFR